MSGSSDGRERWPQPASRSGDQLCQGTAASVNGKGDSSSSSSLSQDDVVAPIGRQISEFSQGQCSERFRRQCSNFSVRCSGEFRRACSEMPNQGLASAPGGGLDTGFLEA